MSGKRFPRFPKSHLCLILGKGRTMKTHFTELAELIATEEKAAFANDLARRIDDLSNGGPTDG